VSTAATPAARPGAAALQYRLLAAGGVGLGLCALGAIFDVERFLKSWLVAFLFWLGLALGSLAILMLQNLTGGRWGLAIRRILEAAARTLPLFAVAFVPLALGVRCLYVWAEPPTALTNNRALSELLHLKEPYLNVTAFLIRAAVYFLVWIGVSERLHRWSVALEERYDPEVARRAQVFSGPGLLLYGLTLTFAAIDWIMSLEPFWNSSIFGAMIAAAQILPALAFAIVVLAWLDATRKPDLADVPTPALWGDLGNLMLAFVMIWAYMTYSQFFLIWSGNLPEEITWYTNRDRGGWQVLAWGLIIVYFGLPFVLLLSRGLKRDPRTLVWPAGAVLVMHCVYQFWLIVPAQAHIPGLHHEPHFTVHWLDLAALVGLGGVWLALFLWRLQSRPLLPLNDPALQEVPHHG
jgi:hypothetical protein